MKILIATGIYPPDIGGPATYSKLLYDELPRRGFDIEVVSFGEVRKYPKIIRHAVYFWKILSRAAHADIVYAQDPVSVGLPALLAAGARSKKFIVRIAGDYAWEQGTQRYGVTERLDEFSLREYKGAVNILKKIQKHVADHAEYIVTPSEYLKKIISNWGVDQGKIKVIYNGFNPTLPKGLKSTLRRSLGMTGTSIISAGRLVPWKGFSALIESFALIKKSLPDAELFIAGEGPDKDMLVEKAAEQGVTGNVHFLGKVPQAKLFEYIKAADVFVLNTDYEGFSHQLIETMALGTAVITTPVGGNTELIVDGKTGLFRAYNDIGGLTAGVLEIIRNPSHTDRMTKAARARAQSFTDERMLTELVAFLHTLS